MSWLEIIGRVAQMMAVPSLGVGFSLLAESAVALAAVGAGRGTTPRRA